MAGPQSPRALTAEEWNAAYFLGLEAIFRGGCRCNVPEQVLEGARRLAAAGYRFRNFDPARARRVDGHLTPSGTREWPCGAIADGSFDTVERARRAVAWLHAHAARVGTRWLEGLIATYDALHPAPAGGRPMTSAQSPAAAARALDPHSRRGTMAAHPARRPHDGA